MISFGSFTGRVIGIQNVASGDFRDGCVQMFELQNEEGILARFIVSPDTYVLNQEMMAVGDIVTGYYDANAPMIMIYPPQYPALVMVKEHADRQVKVSYFDTQLVSEDNWLALNLDFSTQIVTTNGQAFMEDPAGHHLVVVYGPSTKSIPAQTTPYQIVVLCQ
ncbi:hypothetical protein FH966_01905 [Lentibacillus cibarius]|uniref:Uncharacterized protein n=1 Tax=Lentibacillus cibarius TaxID=2583219 RepID=A0A549YFA9_9BACI|nr:hypothetical protein [Lentibacillus cibarius]TRM10573.1 hypothetical protein FH966_01905 [Lentibacillus cibarius]